MMTRICAVCGKMYYWEENFVYRRLCRDCEDRTDCPHWQYDGCKDLTEIELNFRKKLQSTEVEEINTFSLTNFKVSLSDFLKFESKDIQAKKKHLKEYL